MAGINRCQGLYYLSCIFWIITLILWIVFWLFNPYTGNGEITFPILAMFFISVIAILASIFKRKTILIVSSLISLLPIGLYFLGSPGIFSLIGLINIFCLVLSVSIIITNRKIKNNKYS